MAVLTLGKCKLKKKVKELEGTDGDLTHDEQKVYVHIRK